MIGHLDASPQRPGRSFRARRGLALAALAVWALFIGIYYLRGAASSTTPEPIVRPAMPGNVLARTLPVDTAEPPSPRVPEKLPGPKAAEEREDLEGAQRDSVNQDPGPGPYFALYGGRSGRLSQNASVHPSNAPVRSVSQGKGPKLMAWAASTRVNRGQPAMLRAIVVSSSGQLINPESISVTVALADHVPDVPASPMLAAPAGDESQFVYKYLPNPNAGAQPPGASAGENGPHSASRDAPPQEYEFVVRARGVVDGVTYDKVTGGFFLVQDVGAKLDSNSTKVDFVRGNFELTVGLKVEREGTYLVSAELWEGAGGERPIAFARQRIDTLQPGDQRANLLFGGKIIRDANIDGPYIVRNVQLLQVDSIPPHASDPIDQLPKTQALRSNDFY